MMANRLTTASGLSTPHNTTVCGSVSPSKTFDGAELFPVAVGVQVPYVGGGETSTRARHAALALPEEYPLKLAPPSLGPTGATLVLGKGPSSPRDESSDKLGNLLSQYNTSSDKSNFQLPKSYLKKVCCGLTFDEGVLQDRAPHTLPYKEDELKSVFTTQGLVRPRQKHTGPVGRHDPRTGIQRHPPCHLQGPRKLKPLKRSKTVPRTIMDIDMERRQSTFGRREVKGATPAEQLSPDLSKHEWDEHVLASLSKTTADLIVKDHLTGPDKERLVTFLAKRNSALEKPDGMSDEKSDNASVKKTRRSPVKKSKDERKSQKDEAHQQDVHYSPCFTLPSRVGDKKLETHNIFQQEMLAGAQPVLSKKQEEGVIVLDTNDKLKFQKQLQDTYPQEPKVWYSQKKRTAKKKAKIVPAGQKPTKGLQRWNQLPVVVQDDSYISSMPSNVVDLQTLTAGYKLRKKIKEDSNVVKIVEEWRSKWFLERKWQNSSTQELIKAMNDINDHVRLSAVSACSKAAEIRQKAKKEEPNLGIQLLDKNKEEEVPLISTLEPDLIDTIRKLLDDRNTQVRIAAAITLYTINRPDDKTRSILLWTMDHGGAPERWAATQCLALSGVITDNIIAELVSQLQSDTTVRAEKAGVLLADLSRHSGIVHSLIAELLNSSSWKDRVTACKVIPKLNGGINKDMTQKLSYLMWNDWSKDVRTVAAQALGRTGNGKLVHDALRERILTGNERVKVDALKKLSNLGIMTVRLLPALLECFKSEYVSVRIEAAMVAGLLHITDNKLISVLQYLSSDDKSWKVKAHAIKALGSIGVVDDKLIEVLVWAIRYDKVAAVRAEACNAAAVLGLRDARLLSVLQDRLVVESEDLVKREAISALQSLGIEPVGDVDMIEAIRKEVRRLCNRNAVVSHILAEDQAAEYKDDFKRLLTTQEAERESTMVTRLSLRPERTMSRASEASQRGWDPILAGYQAREILSRAPTPGELRMERSLLPMDLNSASSENSSVCGTENWSEGEGHGGADYPEGEGYGLGDYSGEEGDGTVDRVRPGKEFENNMENAKLENGGSGSEETGSASNELDLNTVKVPFQDHNHTNDSRDNEAKRETPAKEERAAEYESSMGEPELLRLVEEEEEEEEEDDSAL